MAQCVIYLVLTGMAAFFLCRCLPKTWFHGDRFPYCSFPAEQNGRIYERLHIKAWQDKVPDMSRIFPGLMPKKRLGAHYEDQLAGMIQETCVAELIHAVLCLTGLRCLTLWPGKGDIVMSILNIFGNAVFMMIQRYNRPRLTQLLRNVERRHSGKEHACEF